MKRNNAVHRKIRLRFAVTLLTGLLSSVDLLASTCNNSADLLTEAQWVACRYAQALSQLEQQHYEAAASVLAELLIHAPNHAGAWMDLATVYHKLGRREELFNTLEVMEQRFRVPPAIQLIIERYRKGVVITAEDNRALLLQIELELGHGSNLNNASRHDVVQLAGADVVLTGNSLPKSGAFNGLTLQALWQKRAGAWMIRPWMVLRKARYRRAPENDSLITVLGVGGQRPISQVLDLLLTGYYLRLNSRHESDQEKLWLQAKLKRPFTEALSVDYWIERQYDAVNEDGGSVKSRLGAEIDYLHHRSLWFAALEYEEDHPKTARSGGAQQSMAGKLGMRYHFSRGGAVLQVRYRMENDQDIYNQTLFGDVYKNLRQLRIESNLQLNIQSNQSLVFWLDYIKESSAIKLFDTTGVQGGMRWQYNW